MRNHLQNFIGAFLSALFAAFLVGATVYAATTISTDIATGGTLSVIGLSTLNGGATTTILSSSRVYVGNNSTTTLVGDSGTSTFSGGLSVSTLSVVSASATSTFGNGIDIGRGCFSVAGVCISAGATSSVNQVTSSGSLTITPTTGNVTVNLNLANANTWSAAQTFSALTQLSSGASTTRLSATKNVAIGGNSTTTIYGDSATSTFSGGINLSNGCFAIGNTCITGSSTGGSVSSVSSSDNSLSITASTGPAVTASINVAHTNVWTATQAMTGPFIASSTATFNGGVSVGTGGTSITNIVHGSATCSGGIVAASSTTAYSCTATGIDPLHQVFVEVITPLDPTIFLQSAFASASSTITIRLANIGTTSPSLGSISVSYFGIR